jgi:acyl-CoA thioester hydrolase
MFVLKSAALDYQLPAQLDDQLIVNTEVEKLGKAVVIFVQKIWRDDQCLVEGRFKVGCVNTKTIRPCAIPSAVMHAVQSQSPLVSIV